jgi:hypothetical protein
MPSRSQQRHTSFRQSFQPYFAQHTDEERERLNNIRTPLRVCFTWAVRHEVSSRADDDDVDNGRAAYLGQAMSFNKNNQLSAPTMKFNSGRNYCNWHESQYHATSKNHSSYAVPPEEIDDVPDWMLDLESEQHPRFQ